VTRSRWLDWRPKSLSRRFCGVTYKTIKTGFCSFEGATSAKSPEMQREPDAAELARASSVLNRAGARIMQLDACTTSASGRPDGPKVPRRWRFTDRTGCPSYLDGPHPHVLQLRREANLSQNVLLEMERSPREPWKVLDRHAQEMAGVRRLPRGRNGKPPN